MKRSLETLTTREFDVLVIGGGIYGALAAWDAALRGLSVALIERGDFGSGTSQNSLRIIHGGLRYLQDGNLGRIRTMARERTTWMKIAPHLVHPLKCVMPTSKKLSRSKPAMTAALALNDLLSFDRNRLPDPQKYLRAGRTVPAGECARVLPGYEDSRMTGAAVWHDAQMYNSERLVLAFVQSAVALGATAANYVEATGFLQQGRQVTGARARDVLTGQEFTIRARVTINAAGAWVDRLLGSIEGVPAVQTEYAPSVAIDLIVNQVWPECGAGISSRPGGQRRSQLLFVVPWHGVSMIGTWHIPYQGAPEDFRLEPEVVAEFLDAINSAHPRLQLTPADVLHAHWGFLPVARADRQNPRVRLVRDSQVVDHYKAHGLDGLMSIIGVKYTTARVIAEKAVDLALVKLSKTHLPSRTGSTPVSGGEIERFAEFVDRAQIEAQDCLEPEIIKHLVHTYGTGYREIVNYVVAQPALGERLDPRLPVTRAEVVHAARCEMAQKLLDVIQRRTEAGTVGLPAPEALQAAAALMGRELGWDDARQQREIEEVLQAYPFRPAERMVAAQ